MSDEDRVIERMARELCRRADCQAVRLVDGEPLVECEYGDECAWRAYADDARAAYSIAREEIERGLREAPPRPILPDLTDDELAARMRHHVISRNGLAKDDSGEVVLPNGAWAMLLEAADRLQSSRGE